MDIPTAKYPRSSSLLHEMHQQLKQTLWSFYSLGIIFNICFCLCQELLTLQTVPFHYLHVVPPLQVNLNTSCQLCWCHSRETTTLWSNCPFRRFDRGTVFVLILAVKHLSVLLAHTLCSNIPMGTTDIMIKINSADKRVDKVIWVLYYSVDLKSFLTDWHKSYLLAEAHWRLYASITWKK